MRGAGEGLLKPDHAVRRAHGAGNRGLLNFLLCLIAVTAFGAVIVAGAMGQGTVALVVALVSGAFFAGMMC